MNPSCSFSYEWRLGAAATLPSILAKNLKANIRHSPRATLLRTGRWPTRGGRVNAKSPRESSTNALSRNPDRVHASSLAGEDAGRWTNKSVEGLAAQGQLLLKRLGQNVPVQDAS